MDRHEVTQTVIFEAKTQCIMLLVRRFNTQEFSELKPPQRDGLIMYVVHENRKKNWYDANYKKTFLYGANLTYPALGKSLRMSYPACITPQSGTFFITSYEKCNLFTETA